MDASNRTNAADSTPTLDKALAILQRWFELAATEHRHGEVGIVLKLQDGKITTIREIMEFTTK